MGARTDESEAPFDDYVETLVGGIGHADRAEPLKDYCLGLLMPVERKSLPKYAPAGNALPLNQRENGSCK